MEEVDVDFGKTGKAGTLAKVGVDRGVEDAESEPAEAEVGRVKGGGGTLAAVGVEAGEGDGRISSSGTKRREGRREREERRRSAMGCFHLGE